MGRLSNNSDLAAAIKEDGRRQKGFIMPFPALFGISVVFGLAAWGAVAWHVWPALKERSAPENLKPILLLHGFRFLGLAFLLPGVVSPDLPAAFAQSVAYGDLISAILTTVAVPSRSRLSAA